MDLNQTITIIHSVGFPIFIALWFMLRTEKVIQKMTDSLDKLNEIEAREIEVLRIVMLKHGLDDKELKS